MPALLRIRTLTAAALIVIGLFLVACGTVAEEPRPTFEPTQPFVRADRAGEDVQVVAVEPTHTPIPPTATPIPPTPTPEVEETEVATEEPTAEVAEAGVTEELPGDPEIGKLLFENVTSPSTSQNCATACHNVNEPLPGTGPYLYGIGTVAGSRIPGISAQDYLFQSIMQPSAFLAPPQTEQPWPDNLMPHDWGQVLTEQDVWHIVAYLMTLTQAPPE
ncbi:MAG: hypothetical protein DPW16_19225 [Chloroflexi bacterium]|nr:hypothetical protein [Chloroflexota bacterium]